MMKTIHLGIIAVLISSGIILLYSEANFGLAERYFEDVRNGLACQKPGSNCPGTDFHSPEFYGMVGLGVFAAGTILHARVKIMLARLVLGIVSLVTGVPALVIGIFAYLDDYNHYVTIMEKCSKIPCMTPNIFADIQYVVFFVTYGSILSAVGGVILVMYFRRENKK